LIFWRNPIRALGMDQGPIIVVNVSDSYAKAVQATRPHAEPIQ
jgi:hypothetical protein